MNIYSDKMLFVGIKSGIIEIKTYFVALQIVYGLFKT